LAAGYALTDRVKAVSQTAAVLKNFAHRDQIGIGFLRLVENFQERLFFLAVQIFIGVRDQDRFFCLGQIAEDRLADILLRVKDADNIILNLKGLPDEQAQFRQHFYVRFWRAGQQGPHYQRTVEGVARGLERVIQHDVFFADFPHTLDAKKRVDKFAHGGKYRGLDKVTQGRFFSDRFFFYRKKRIDRQSVNNIAGNNRQVRAEFVRVFAFGRLGQEAMHGRFAAAQI